MSYTEEFLKEIGNEVAVNTASVIALGFGPVSPKRLAELVVSGKAVAAQTGGEIHFTKATFNK